MSFRAGDTRKRNLAALNALDIAAILPRADQFVLAPPHELEQIVEELADVGSTHEVLQTQIADTASQEHPEILLVEHTETSAAAVEQSVAPRMEGAGLQAVDGGTLQFLSHASLHLRRGVIGIGERQNFVRASVPFADEASHALREHGGLPRAGSGDHQHRTMNVSNGLLLAFIGEDLRHR